MPAAGSLTADYGYELPPERIAQRPASDRDGSRLMVVHRATGAIEHRRFSELVTLIPAFDALVLNTTRVMRARLLGTRDSGAPAEIFLLRALDGDLWEAMVRPGGKLRPGHTVHVAPELDVEIVEATGRGTRVVRLNTSLAPAQAIEQFGHVPLPPYITRADEQSDEGRYQTVYARESGSVAAPTAGLHFTAAMLEALALRGVRRADVVLHVGAGTFKPVEVDDPAGHVMHEESYTISDAAAATVNEARTAGASVWAVGTTSVRALESAADDAGRVSARSAETRIFIRPPYRFRVVDRLVTNFHLPRSTLMMLVAAFAGYELTMHAYAEALAHDYRFYSYGDAMVVL